MTRSIPSFFIYGEPDRPLELGFMHSETVMERRAVHHGCVAAHKHDRMAQITFWSRGRGTYFIEDMKLDFIAPAVSFVPSGIVHGFDVDADASDAIVVSIADSALPPLRALIAFELDRPVMVRGQAESVVWGHLRYGMERIHSDYKTGLSTALPALAAVAISDIGRLANLDRFAPSGSDDLAQSFRQLVDMRFRENLPIEHYVEALGTTTHLLGKASHATFGLSAKGLIDERRLLEAKRLLLFTVRSVEDIAYELGFRDPAYFSRFFRLRAGEPPGRWREVQARRPG